MIRRSHLLTFSVPSTAISDVKVYVDLASISAGENDAEIDQVACFHDAVMGYAPLLYSLSPQAGFEDFMKCAHQVWDAQSRDDKLPDKLVLIFFFSHLELLSSVGLKIQLIRTTDQDHFKRVLGIKLLKKMEKFSEKTQRET